MLSYGDPAIEEWHLRIDEAEPLVRRAVEGGINYFDTADRYSLGRSEEITGQLLSRFFQKREDYVLATKVYFPMGDGPNDRGLSRKHVLSSIDASLRRLGTEYVDLYQIHRWDYATPIEETMEALNDVVRSGKARYLGASSMHAWQFSKAQYVAHMRGWTPFISMQNHYNLIYREEEREMIPLCLDQGVGVIPWSPLAKGLLAGNRSRTGELNTVRARSDRAVLGLYQFNEGEFDIVDALRAVSRQRGLRPAQVALAWLRQRPGVVAPTVGATKALHIEDAIASVSVTLSDEEISTLEAGYLHRPIVGHE